MRIRLLGDAVLRRRASEVADGWDGPRPTMPSSSHSPGSKRTRWSLSTRSWHARSKGIVATTTLDALDADALAHNESVTVSTTGAVQPGVPLVHVLLVTMYFPPAGGGGVQRSLSSRSSFRRSASRRTCSRRTTRSGCTATPSSASRRRPGSTAPATSARAHGSRRRSSARQTGGRAAVVQAQVTARRLLLPDASVTWNLTAIPAAIRIARREGIDAVITTSPPPSVHFVGAAVQSATGARWIADLRDPLVANQHRRDDTTAARARQAAIEQVARLVARRPTRSRASRRRSRTRCGGSARVAPCA